jgi:hypothetical protein
MSVKAPIWLKHECKARLDHALVLATWSIERGRLLDRT